MSEVTAFVTRDSRRESRYPTRPDPTLTDPAHLQNYVWSPSTTSSLTYARAARIEVVATR